LKRAIVGIYVIYLALLQISCNTTDPPDNEQNISLKLEDVSCTEAWIELTTTNLPLPATVTFKRTNSAGDTKSQILNLNTNDSLLYIDSLSPNQAYQYQASSIENPATSNELSVTTMDTTSHNFTFETFTFGGTAGSSVLYDVAIFSADNIWCVGEIYVADTSQNGYTTYNAVYWDGNQWELKRIHYYGSCSAVEYPPLKAIWAFSENDIVITNGGSIGWFDGSIVNLDCRVNPLLTGAINKIWGSSSSDLYVVGNSGNIAHYNGQSWTRIESGTTTDINDVWGTSDDIENWTVYCAVSFVLQTGDKKILKINYNSVDSLTWNTGRRVHSVWTNSENYLYTGGGGIFENKRGYWNEITEVPLYYSRNIRGSDLNNLFVCGDFGFYAHFNGSGWKTFSELSIQGIYYAVAVKGNTVISVGFEGSKAIIVKGIKN